MSNFRQHKSLSSGFTTIPNSIFRDNRMSLKAVGLLCRLLSLPSDWEFSEAGLVAITKDGRDSIRSAIKELETLGYLHRERARSGGKFAGAIWHVYEFPFKPQEKEDGTKEYSPVPQDYYYNWMEV